MTSQLVPFQFQFDVLSGATLAAKFISSLLNICAADDIQPLAIPPLELLGDLLMADGVRIQAGVIALKHRHTVRWKPRLIVVSPMTAKLVRVNMRMTSVFLFAAACSVCFSVSSASSILYEMMRLSGALSKYSVTSEVVFQFIEIMNGFREGFGCLAPTAGFGPRETYEKLCMNASNLMRALNMWITDLYEENDVNMLASLLQRTFEAARDQDNELIILEGSKGGLWIAFVLLWIRPAETRVFLADMPLYPTRELADIQSGGHARPRFLIHLRERMEDDWSLEIWDATRQPTESIRFEDVPQHAKLKVELGFPWVLARRQVELINPRESVVLAIGHLAGALVQIATEHGRLVANGSNGSALLKDICPMWYLGEYTSIMNRLGWNDLTPERQMNMAAIIGEVQLEFKAKDDSEDTDYFASLIFRCISRYNTRFQEPMLIHAREGSHESHIVEHAVHLAAQVVEMTAFRELPTWVTYRPLDPTERMKSSNLLRSILHDARGCRSRKAEMSNLQARAIRAMIPTAKLSNVMDLAYAGEGYVVFRSALAREYARSGSEAEDITIQLDDPRQVGTYQVLPGFLQYRDVPGRYRKLSEYSLHPGGYPQRLDPSAPRVRLFTDNGIFRGVSEEDGRELGRTCFKESVRYLLRKDDAEQTIFLTTHLSVSRDEAVVIPGLESAMPTSWWRSIESTMFANHIRQNTSSQAQLEALADVWTTEGANIRWAKLDLELPETPGRHIMATIGDFEGRFFAAGCVPSEVMMFIRHRGVSLTHCVKVAMESKTLHWVIIA
ncbi:hypothetical protein JX265_002646 [Neoarthrinium moseri]|uniref:Uncharacterized protein n=1 Tax=Neoarthrinium moseri TaxID=1658444 RepID=A0A9P9WV84_9PEZI|nr:hypothetical protein JX265_002646 [Neoarthrinium moseri]